MVYTEYVKKVFLKAPSRVLKFRELFPELPLPPQPIPDGELG